MASYDIRQWPYQLHRQQGWQSPPLWDEEDLVALEEDASEETMDVDGEVVEEGASEIAHETKFDSLMMLIS